MLSERLEDCYGREVKVLALDIAERETIIRSAHPVGKCVPTVASVSRLGTT